MPKAADQNEFTSPIKIIPMNGKSNNQSVMIHNMHGSPQTLNRHYGDPNY